MLDESLISWVTLPVTDIQQFSYSCEVQGISALIMLEMFCAVYVTYTCKTRMELALRFASRSSKVHKNAV